MQMFGIRFKQHDRCSWAEIVQQCKALILILLNIDSLLNIPRSIKVVELKLLSTVRRLTSLAEYKLRMCSAESWYGKGRNVSHNVALWNIKWTNKPNGDSKIKAKRS